jgi:hypothetical protein
VPVTEEIVGGDAIGEKITAYLLSSTIVRIFAPCVVRVRCILDEELFPKRIEAL